MTRRPDRTVLAVIHTVTSGQRLLDVIRLLENDLRVQVVFTTGPDVFGTGVAELLQQIGGVVLPWQQAIQDRFSLAIAAAYGGIEDLHAPIIVIPHGAGYNKNVSRRLHGGVAAARGVYGLAAQELIRDGMVIPSAIALAHDAELRRLASSCPEAIPVATVVGDPTHDRLLASAPQRPAYRRALNIDDDQELVVLTSTWGHRSLFGQHLEFVHQLLSELPRDRYHLALLLHPNVWFGHGIWQIRTWLASCLRRGLALVPPEADWRGALLAADHVIGDHGSVAVYATLTDASVLLANDAREDLDPQSAGGLLAMAAPQLRPDRPLAEQLHHAALHCQTDRYAEIVGRLTSAPGRFDVNMRRLMYRLMQLPQPPTIPRAEPVPPPILTR